MPDFDLEIVPDAEPDEAAALRAAIEVALAAAAGPVGVWRRAAAEEAVE